METTIVGTLLRCVACCSASTMIHWLHDILPQKTTYCNSHLRVIGVIQIKDSVVNGTKFLRKLMVPVAGISPAQVDALYP